MKYFYALVLSSILLSCSSSQRIAYLQVPSDSKVDTIDVAAYEKKYGKDDGVYLFHEESIEHSGTTAFLDPGGTWDFHRVVRHKYIILNPDNQDLTTFELGVSKRAKIGTF